MLRIDRLTKSYGARTLFADATYHFPSGERIALVGANGAGKTTLLNVLSGLEPADGGTVTAPQNVRVGYLPQKPNANPQKNVLLEAEDGAKHVAQLKRDMDKALEEMHGKTDEVALARYEQAETAFRIAGGYALEARATEILRGLGFKPDDLAKSPTELSGGWRMRLELARLFLSEPEFLILDEPTNHLDLPSLVWVENYLQMYRGTLLFVSHDRALLNRLATITLHLSAGKLTPYRGNFDQFLETREARMEQEAAQAEQLKRRREQMERFVERFGAKATKAAQAQSRVKMIARIREVEESLGGQTDEAEVFIQIPAPPKTPRLVYEIEGGAIGYAVTLAQGIDLSIERGAKIAVIGANGIGKSTLLRTVARRIPARGGRFEAAQGVEIAYFAQDQAETLDLSLPVLTNLLKQSDLSEKEARSLLGGFLFRGDDVFKKSSVLSGGELSRLGLACTLAKRAGFLLLDEPTNHLDMASVESLAAGVDAYEGTVLFVSHDRTFIDAVCTHVFAMLPDGRSMLFEGKLDDYARLAELAGFPNVLHAEPEQRDLRQSGGGAGEAKDAGAKGHQEVKELQRRRQKLERQVEQLDKAMHQAREKIGTLEAQMAGLDVADYAKASALHADTEAARGALDAAEMEWLQASEELEAISSELQRLGRG